MWRFKPSVLRLRESHEVGVAARRSQGSVPPRTATLGIIPIWPDIVVTKPDSPEVLHAVEVKGWGSDRRFAETQIKDYRFIRAALLGCWSPPRARSFSETPIRAMRPIRLRRLRSAERRNCSARQQITPARRRPSSHLFRRPLPVAAFVLQVSACAGLLGYAVPAHHKRLDAVKLPRSRAGEVLLHLPALCITEVRQPISTKRQPRQEANAVRRFLLRAKEEGTVWAE